MSPKLECGPRGVCNQEQGELEGSQGIPEEGALRLVGRQIVNKPLWEEGYL